MINPADRPEPAPPAVDITAIGTGLIMAAAFGLLFVRWVTS